ncbi:hypothetical protein N7517_011168 [Penicillium concentricum]|uniref:PH-response regulator protein palH/RIM21 n=1 Tax=Penicillium concentricum TaxID=293559 RepID=A0A9W9UU10_9EURO|nr:uncharacterized protein N7517_011168 [Penicillium concentricum]KAJ5356559.1 hypothetical protein N7517_011168 [Penicillium concentricum]
MENDFHLIPRQIWANPTPTTTKIYSPGCTPVVLPSNGLVYLNKSFAITLSENAIFEPTCTGSPTDEVHISAVLDTRDPFYSSITPQLYAIGCATVVSYLLVIILLITPRTFYVGGPGGGGANFLGRHGMIKGSYSGNSSVVGVGGRPWLQKVAAILVAISLTIATVDSFRVAERQYNYGFSDAEALSQEVIDGMEIRIVRVISSTFLWLAQVQTLIRLFPRHKEKVMIKWAGFALIVLDTTLYEDAIPALSYLFELSLNLLYAAWVIFYSISKHRYAFFHPKMRNICLVALLSLCAILIPVVFFVLDIAKPEIAGWGTYIRWVGSAAASVVVWEWVERIEALERDETKDGILGREVFDGDEMLEVTPSEEVDWPRFSPQGPDQGGNGASSGWGGMMGLAHRPLRARAGLPRGNRKKGAEAPPYNQAAASAPRGPDDNRPTPPPVTTTPISRADTTSAASTVYNVRYHSVASPTPPAVMPNMQEEELDEAKELESREPHTADPNDHALSAQNTREQSPQIVQADPRWHVLLHPFKRRRASLPKEVASAQAGEESSEHRQSAAAQEAAETNAARSRADHFFSLHRKARLGTGPQNSDGSLPVTVIPARRRGQHTWSPQNRLLEDTRPPGESRPIEPQHHEPAPNRPNLPVRVIPSQPQASAPWTEADVERGGGDYVLHYDPEAAALVNEDVSHLDVTNYRQSWTDTTYSDERNDVSAEGPQAEHGPNEGRNST